MKTKPGEKKIIDIPEQSRQIEVQDEEFFDGDDVGDYSFLGRLDEKELGKRVEKEKIQREEKPKKVKAPLIEESEEYSDEEELSDVLNHALDTKEVEEKDWDEEQAYEQKPRKGDSQWRKKESTKLPVRTVNGGLQQIDASDSEDASSETEESDSDGEADETTQVAEEQPTKTGPEAVIEAKEALARLAEEIVELPEEKVSCFNHSLTIGIKLEDLSGNLQQGQSNYQETRLGNPAHRLQGYYSWVRVTITD